MPCLAEISPLGGGRNWTSAIATLVDGEVVYRRGEIPEASYIFKHALVRDAAYESLLKTRRVPVSTSALPKALVKLHPDQMTKQPEVLAYHYSEGRDEHRGSTALDRGLEACY